VSKGPKILGSIMFGLGMLSLAVMFITGGLCCLGFAVCLIAGSLPLITHSEKKSRILWFGGLFEILGKNPIASVFGILGLLSLAGSVFVKDIFYQFLTAIICGIGLLIISGYFLLKEWYRVKKLKEYWEDDKYKNIDYWDSTGQRKF